MRGGLATGRRLGMLAIPLMRWFLLPAIAIQGIAATFHVAPGGDDRADGSSRTPWATIQRAVDHPAVEPGDTIRISAGEYDGTLLIARGGAWRRPLTIRAEDGVYLRGGMGLRITARGPVVVENLRVEPDGPAGVVVSGTTPGVVLRRLQLNGGGITLENTIGVLIDACAISEANIGIAIEGRNTIVRNNLISRCREAGIALGGEGPAWDTQISHNTLLENGASAAAPGGIWIAWEKGSRIERNIIRAAAGRRVLTMDGGQAFFADNLYFSPNDLAGTAWGWRGRTERGFWTLRRLTRDPGARFADPVWTAEGLHSGSPAIDGGLVRPAAGERDFFGRPRRIGMYVDLGAAEHPDPPGLRVSGNQLVHRNQVVRLRGVGVGDPVLDRRERPASDYAVIRNLWNANTVRISLHANVWRDADQFGGRKTVIDWLRHDIAAATSAGLYVILDWHVTGWPDGYSKPSEPGEPEGLHDPNFALAESFWDAAARAFGRSGNVAFELWNEPVRGPDDWKPDPEAWNQLRPYLERLTEIVRQHSENLVIVTGGSWAYGLPGIRANPPSDLNTAIAWHVYAGKENNDEARWAAALDDLHHDFPVIVTEWGFAEDGAPHFRGGVADFAGKFARNWLEGRSLHWVAWCWHPTVGPSLIERDWHTPTSFGRVTGSLLRANTRPILRPPASIRPDGSPARNYMPFSINR